MKTNHNFTVIYILLALAQMVICNYCRISPFIYVTILPAMVLALPLKINTAWSMAIAFVTGLAVDFLSEGIIGLNTLSLVPVAFIRHQDYRYQENTYRGHSRICGIHRCICDGGRFRCEAPVVQHSPVRNIADLRQRACFARNTCTYTQ